VRQKNCIFKILRFEIWPMNARGLLGVASFFGTFLWVHGNEVLGEAEKLAHVEQVVGLRDPTAESKPVAFCCSACMDVSVDASAFVSHVIQHFGLTERDFKPKFHAVLSTIEEFIESFLFFFQRGANAEQRMLKPEMFAQLVELAKKEAKMKSYPGGNALTMAQRVALEGGVKVVLGGQLSEEAKTQLPSKLEYVAPTYNNQSGMDIHLTLEYQTGDTINGVSGISSPRMNRYYMNADIHNARLTSAKALQDYMHKQPDAKDYIMVVSGLQLADRERLNLDVGEGLDTIASTVSRHHGPAHFESGAFEDEKIFEAAWSRGILHSVASIGLNEQELAMLDWKLHSSDTPQPRGSQSKPALKETLDTTRRVLHTLSQEGSLSRMHFHTLHFHAVCYNPDVWSSGVAAVAAGSAVTSELSCGTAFANRDMSAFDLRYAGPVSCEKSTASDGESGSKVIECCVAPVLVCKNPLRTAGLGDNISGAGLRYHSLTPEGPAIQSKQAANRVKMEPGYSVKEAACDANAKDCDQSITI
jgi:ADP-dependent glucokinase